MADIKKIKSLLPINLKSSLQTTRWKSILDQSIKQGNELSSNVNNINQEITNINNTLSTVLNPNLVITAAPGVSATSNVVLVTLTVDNLTITTTGNPVVLGAVGGGASGSGSFFNNSTGSQSVGMRFLWYVGGVLVSTIPFGVSAALGGGGNFAQAPPSAANTFLVLPAGTHSIELRFTKLPIFGSVGDLTCQDIRIYAYELK